MMTKKSTTSKKTGQSTYVAYILLAFVGGLALAWAVQQWSAGTNDSVTTTGVKAYGGDFMLEAPWGKSGLPDYRGKLVLVYFGFTSCPDVCPTSLGIMKAAMATLDESEQAAVRGLFIKLSSMLSIFTRTFTV